MEMGVDKEFWANEKNLMCKLRKRKINSIQTKIEFDHIFLHL